MQRTVLAAIAALGLIGFSASANAVPTPGALQSASSTANTDAAGKLEQVSYTCWYRHGYRHCGYVQPRVYSYYYAAPRYQRYSFYRFGHRRY